jgi:tetratricopeptide (TPR) repeat protein
MELAMKKHFFKGCIMMIAIIASFACIWPEIGAAQDATTYFQKGTEHLRLGELDEALTALTQAINLKSDYAAAYNNRGLTYYEKDPNDTRARDDYLMAIQLDPTNEEAKNNLGIFYFKQGDYANAKIYYTAALPASQAQEKPYHADVYNNLGIIYAKEGMSINAKDAYDNAIRITITKNLDYTNAYYNRGNLYYEQKNYNQAIADYNVTIDFYAAYTAAKDLDYDYSDAYYNRGLCYFNKNQYDQAIADYQDAININPGFIWAHYSKGYIHFLKGEYSQALAEFQQVLNLPNDFRAKEGAHSYAQLGMGLVYHKQGNYELSLEKVKASCSLGNSSACSTLRDLGQL